jgi:hypothetical protein
MVVPGYETSAPSAPPTISVIISGLEHEAALLPLSATHTSLSLSSRHDQCP